jgi:hypothetical protein
MTLRDFLGLADSDAEGRRQDPDPLSPPPSGPAARPGDDCDAAIAPLVTGHVDHDLLDQITARLHASPLTGLPATSRTGLPGTGLPGTGELGGDRGALRDLILNHAVALLSGPGGLASLLRTGTLTGPAASISLPLDLGAVTDTIPPHLRRAVIARDRHCCAPGCYQPPAACQVHHFIPRSKGGQTKLSNLGLVCTFHHLIAIHQWGWTLRLNPDGTTTMTSPDGTRTYHSHAPPATAA